MKRLLQSAMVMLMLVPSVSTAQDWDKGLAAYKAGDYTMALQAWRPLAEQGDAFAQYGLGALYQNGDGVPQDDTEAVKWYLMAAKQAHPEAQSNLGVMYAHGRGVLQDSISAHMWYNLASMNGNEIGRKNLDRAARDMTPASIEEAQRRARVCMASNYKDCD